MPGKGMAANPRELNVPFGLLMSCCSVETLCYDIAQHLLLFPHAVSFRQLVYVSTQPNGEKMLATYPSDIDLLNLQIVEDVGHCLKRY